MQQRLDYFTQLLLCVWLTFIIIKLLPKLVLEALGAVSLLNYSHQIQIKDSLYKKVAVHQDTRKIPGVL